MIDSSAIPASFAAWKIPPSTSMLTALVHSSSRAYLGLGERHSQTHKERKRAREDRVTMVGAHRVTVTLSICEICMLLSKTAFSKGSFYYFYVLSFSSHQNKSA